LTTRPVVLITGASGGIGGAAAIECARRGARIALHYGSNQENAAATLEALDGTGHATFHADLTDPDSIQELATAVSSGMGRIDVLVNNAGISKRHDLAEMDYEQWQDAWRRILDVNLLGAANLSFCVAKLMAANGGGRIINVSSRGAFRGEPQMPWYGASKAGMNAMGQSMALALAPHDIFVFTVAPGFVDTPMAEKTLQGPEGAGIRSQSPLNRVARPDEVGKTIAYLSLEAPEFLTGCIIDLNGASYLRS